jgi:hypothetical protein
MLWFLELEKDVFLLFSDLSLACADKPTLNFKGIFYETKFKDCYYYLFVFD